MKKLLYTLPAALLLFAGCKKIDEGFLSETIRYIDKDVYCLRGLSLVQSQRIDVDGSTTPMEFKMLNLRDLNGAAAPKQFFENYEVVRFKAGNTFDIKTDTTVELLNKKRETVKVPPMEFNPVSGQITFIRTSVNIPPGKYTFDLEAKNVKGTRTYNEFAYINVVEPTTDDIFKVEDNVSNVFHDVTNAVTAHKNPKITVTKVSNDGARIILKLVDKNGNPFNPKAGEIIRRGDRPTFENYAKFKAVEFTDTAMICDFQVAPFPLSAYVDAAGTNWNHLMYYRILSQYVTVDGFTPGTFSVNPRFGFSLLIEGTFIVEFKLTDATRVKP